MNLEKMDEFFERRLEGYEEHQLRCIAAANIFYPKTASLLPSAPGSAVLDLGCGTGLELDEYYKKNPQAAITGIDLSSKMLDVLRAKHPDKDLTLLCGSYFDLPLGEACYDAAVSVESLHHFTVEQNIPLYEKIRRALKEGGFFLLTDYMAQSEQEEAACFANFAKLRCQQGILEGTLCHYDTPLTPEHETQALLRAGFSRVDFLGRWEGTVMLRAHTR